MNYGFDESDNNPHPIGWSAAYTYLKNLGGGAQPFVVVKATQGTGYTNEHFAGDVAAARSAGFAVAAYLMDQGNDNPGAEEAYYRRTAGSVPQTDDIELPEGLTAAQYAQHVAVLVAQDPGALVYLNGSEAGEGFPEGAGLWLADPGKPAGTPARSCVMHQYSWTGTIPGVGGQVDLDCWLGSEAQFDQFFGVTPPAPVPAPVLEDDDDMISTIVYAGQFHTFAVDQSGNLWHRFYVPATPTTAAVPWQHELRATGCVPGQGVAVTTFGGYDNQLHVFAEATAGGQVHCFYTVGVGWAEETLT